MNADGERIVLIFLGGHVTQIEGGHVTQIEGGDVT